MIDLLVTLDENYFLQLRVLLTSLLINSPAQYRVFLVHRAIPEDALQKLSEQLLQKDCELYPIRVPESLFAAAPAPGRYPQEMYYRLLAGQILPQQVKRVLYLDPDTLVINSVLPLWELDLRGKLFAAASHTGKTELANDVNRLRLKTQGDYFNSGVMLIDVARARKEIMPEAVFACVREHARELILPDQDILNMMFEKEICEIDDIIWNYDARKYSTYFLRTSGEATAAWTMEHTAILHFCGAAKPWKPRYRHRFGILYRHYMRLSEKWFGTV